MTHVPRAETHTKFARPVSANEQLYLAGSSAFSKLVIQQVIEGQGAICPEALKQAIKDVSEHMPGTRLKRVKPKLWEASGELPALIISPSYPDIRFNFNTAFNIDHPDYPNQLCPASGRSCEIVHCQREGRTLLIFRALHAVMDGKGLALWIENIFRALRKEPIQAIDSAEVDDTVLKTLKAATRKQEPTRPKCDASYLDRAQDQALQSQPTPDKSTFSIYRQRIEGNDPTIIAKLSAAIQQLAEADKSSFSGKVMIPVDIRDAYPSAKTSSANLSLPLFMTLSSGQTWLDYQRALLNDIQAKTFLAKGKNDALYRWLPNSLLAKMLSALWQQQVKKGKYFVNAAISHLGKRKPELVSTASFEAETVINIPCPIPIAPFSIVVSEFRDQTEICLVTSQSVISQPDEFLSELLDLAELRKQPLTYDAFSPRLEDLKAKREVGSFSLVTHTLHTLFEQQVKLNPSATCVQDDTTQLTYHELNVKANQLAHFLRESNIQSGDFVGVAASGSVSLMTGILATLKAGAVFVPLEPSLPESRLNFMVDDSQLKRVLVQPNLVDKFQRQDRLLVLDHAHPAFASSKQENLNLTLEQDAPCYVIYTSGTTGTPKGSITTHKSATNYFVWLLQALNLNASDCGLHKTPISFDASLMDLFLPILSGGKLILGKVGAHKDMHYLAKQIENNRVTVLCAVPVVMDMLLKATDAEGYQLKSLKHLVIGGEVFTSRLHQKMIRALPNASIINSYGPSECSISTLYFDGSHQCMPGASLPIGYAVPNNHFEIVNPHNEPITDTKEGELIVAGAGVGLGYINRDDLTQAKFFTNETGVRHYRTGDLVKRRKDGAVQFLSRLDNQIKFRGVRIELEEIEQAVNKLDTIDAAVAAVFTPPSGQDALAVFYKSSQPNSLDEQALQQMLAQELPDYMIPRIFKRVESFPQNASGKIDRTQLAETLANLTLEDSTEQMDDFSSALAQCWQAEFKQAISPMSHFFYLGGDSLSAVSLCLSIEKALNIRVDSGLFYEHPHFKAFTRALKEHHSLT